MKLSTLLCVVMTLIFVGMTLVSSASLAHDVWILPSSFKAEPGERLSVDLRVGHAGDEESLVRLEERILRFEQLHGSDQRSIPGLDRQQPAGFLRTHSAGLETLVYESTPAWSELAAPAFERYLNEEGLQSIIERRRSAGTSQQAGRELYSRSLKSLILVEQKVKSAEVESIQDRSTGLPLELVIESRSFDRASDEPTRMQVLFQGQPLPGAWIKARRLDQIQTHSSGRTDSAGKISFDLGTGTWILSTVHMIPAKVETSEDPRADWRTFFSTLTFERRPVGFNSASATRTGH